MDRCTAHAFVGGVDPPTYHRREGSCFRGCCICVSHPTQKYSRHTKAKMGDARPRSEVTSHKFVPFPDGVVCGSAARSWGIVQWSKVLGHRSWSMHDLIHTPLGNMQSWRHGHGCMQSMLPPRVGPFSGAAECSPSQHGAACAISIGHQRPHALAPVHTPQGSQGTAQPMQVGCHIHPHKGVEMPL